MTRFLVDAQLPPALARWLADQGNEAAHVRDTGMLSASDTTIWQHASTTGAAVVTKDMDFAQRRAMSRLGPVIVWIRFPNTRRRELLALCEAAFPAVVAALERGEVLVEVT